MSQISLTGGHILEFDEADRTLVESYSWCAAKRTTAHKITWYAVAHVPGSGKHGKNILLHRLLTNAPRNKNVDHWDGNGLNNRRINLRICGQDQNVANSRPRPGREGLKGIRTLPSGRFRATAARVHLGVFDTSLQAAAAYNSFMQQKYGEFARLN